MSDERENRPKPKMEVLREHLSIEREMQRRTSGTIPVAEAIDLGFKWVSTRFRYSAHLLTSTSVNPFLSDAIVTGGNGALLEREISRAIEDAITAGDTLSEIKLRAALNLLQRAEEVCSISQEDKAGARQLFNHLAILDTTGGPSPIQTPNQRAALLNDQAQRFRALSDAQEGSYDRLMTNLLDDSDSYVPEGVNNPRGEYSILKWESRTRHGYLLKPLGICLGLRNVARSLPIK